MKKIIGIVLIILQAIVQLSSQGANTSYDVGSSSVAWVTSNGDPLDPSELTGCQNVITGRFFLGVTGGGTATGAQNYPLCSNGGFTITLSISGGGEFTGPPTTISGVSWATGTYPRTSITGTQVSSIPMTATGNSGSASFIIDIPVRTPNAVDAEFIYSVEISHGTSICNTSPSPGDNESTDGSTGEFCVLPIVLQSFDAKLIENNTLLTWKSATEKNSDYFEVMKSNDAKDFIVIGKVGANNAEKSYTYVDQNTNVGITYYQLRMVDRDGTSSKSTIKVIEKGGNNRKLSAYPNPFVEGFTLTGLDEGTKIRITDINGKTIYETKVNRATEFISLNSRETGILMLYYVQNGTSKVEKLIKVN